MSDWQPISTAPRDGTAVLVYVAACDLGPPFIAVSCYEEWAVSHREITHWQPLPPPREGGGDE